MTQPSNTAGEAGRDVLNDYFHKFYPSPEQLAQTDERYESVGIVRSVDGVSTIFPQIKCADGFSFSAQGHHGAYSTPRDDFAARYSAVEVMAAPNADELLAPYQRDCNAVGDDMIYPYVPVEVIEQLIKNHGGIDWSKVSVAKATP